MTLKVKGLYKSFDGNIILDNISFQINRGEIVTVIGPSGAGKTTLLRCINGLEKCDGGTIKIDEYFLCDDNEGSIVYCNKQDMRTIRKKVGYVFQNFNLFPHINVMDNIIEAPINVLKMNKKTAKEKAKMLLNKLGLEEKAYAYPFQLSGGQKQRVAIARACALDPTVMCFDEPTSALDPEMREGIASIIEGLAKQNMAILIITHDMLFAKRVSHRMLFIESGKLIAEGRKENNFQDVNNERVINYINS
ncbi:amino acid ABC transporter ATP-binding protein [Alkaliphilus sp. B6464]|uniref:amino acid ABC transporter ATP-binding protein n=1 Tax=Alkaliphilus sp. B6464 TaxID=2731219 RepID=UPI001BA6933B|nr:amino acid ABC transporter ATP-binding protein [Alkaliphilus sp. B6464]QUH19128.1 amino acid ABC transporter ATP-binding protein [Alkaliphilus sp. B6464]